MNDRHETKYLIFSRFKYPDKKTYDVIVRNKSNELLGKIYWRGGFRAYVFNPRSDLEFDTKCMQDIIDYIKALTEERNDNT
jgi:hypothetical protein